MRTFSSLRTALAVCLSLFTVAAHAQFSASLTGTPVNTTGWTYGGSTGFSGNTVQLTSSLTNQKGYIYYSTPVNLAQCSNFTVTFDFQITGSSSPSADGFTFFYISNPPTGFTAGNALGLPSNINGLVAIFDTYDNDGNNNNPLVSLRGYTNQNYVEGNNTGLIGSEETFQAYIKNGQWHTAIIQYTAGNLTTSIDGINQPQLAGNYPLTINGYFGFSASTGALYATHSIRNVTIAAIAPSIAPTVADVSYCQDDAAVPLTATAATGGSLIYYDAATGGNAYPSAPTPSTTTPGVTTVWVDESNGTCEGPRAAINVTVYPKYSDTFTDYVCYAGTYNYAGNSYTNAGYYPASFTSVHGCDSVSTLHLIVNPILTGILDTTICHGQSVTYNGASHNTSGTYIDTLVTPGGCDSQITLHLVVNPPLTYNSTINICQGQNYIFNGNPLNTSGNYIDTFTTGGGCDSIVFLNLIVHPVYTGNAPNDTICVGMTAPLCVNVSQPAGVIFTVSWAANPASPIGNPFAPCTTGQPAVDTRYIATIIPDGLAACAVNDTVDVKVLQGFTISNGDTSICLGSTVKINGTSDILYTYFWSPSAGVSNVTAFNPQITPDTTHTYTITASYPGCPDSSQSITITVEPVPTVFAGSDTVLCYGTRYSIPATVTPAFPLYTYTWTPDSALDNGHILNPVFTAKDTATLTLVIATPAGCQNRDSLKISVIPQHFFTLSNDTAICPGDSATLQATLINGITNANMLWTPNFHLSDTTDTLVYANPPYYTNYIVYASEVHGCRDTDNVIVTVHPKALLSLPDSTTLYPGDSYQMNPQGNCLYFAWFPLLGLDNAVISNPVAQPPVNTRYYVTATTEEGCSTRDSIDVFVMADSRIDVPNAFSPGHGPNATIKPVHLGDATLLSFRIFDRWGQKVFETNTLEDGWDGTLNGTPQPMGVYIYVVEAQTYQGKPFHKQGNITLIR